MSDSEPISIDSFEQRLMALSRWDNEGGALPDAAPSFQAPSSVKDCLDAPDLTNAELIRLRVRVIALENLMIALLAQGSQKQRVLARDMAAHISPRPGAAVHPLTSHAATQMVHLVLRADHFRSL